MSKYTKRLRSRAGEELRSSRKMGSTVTKGEHAKRAASYKELAANKEWLEGERPRSRKRKK